jgi:hypothetical protein
VSVEQELQKIKRWYYLHYPLCVFCGHKVREGDLAHLIRRSHSPGLKTLKLNTGLAHRECHNIYDNDPGQSQYLPRMPEVLYIIYLLDREYFNQISDNYPLLYPFIKRFPEVDLNPSHHGEILTLWYLL